MIPFSMAETVPGGPRTESVPDVKGSHNTGREETGRPYDEALDAFITRFVGGRITAR